VSYLDRVPMRGCTHAKYREAMGIGSSARRRRAKKLRRVGEGAEYRFQGAWL